MTNQDTIYYHTRLLDKDSLMYSQGYMHKNTQEHIYNAE